MPGRYIEVRSIKRDVLKEETRYFSVGYFTDLLNQTDATWYELLECETSEIAYCRRDELQKLPCYNGVEETRLKLEDLVEEALELADTIKDMDAQHNTLLGSLSVLEHHRGNAKRRLRLINDMISEYETKEEHDGKE